MLKRKREMLHHQTRNIIFNVASFFESEKVNNALRFPVDQVLARTAAATGYSKSTVSRVRREGIQANVMNKPIPRKKPRKAHNKIEVNESQLCRLRKIIFDIYTERKQVPTLNKIIDVAKQKADITCSRSTLSTMMKNQLGFHYKRIKKNQVVLIERHNYKVARANYLDRLRKNDALGPTKKPVIYVGVKIIHTITVQRSKILNDNTFIMWILLHAGGEMGFIDKAKLLFKNVSETDDNQVLGKKILKWVKEVLIPNLPRNTIVVLDNTPYYKAVQEKIPSVGSTRSEIMKWLSDHDVSFDKDMLKVQLCDLVKQYKSTKTFILDEILEEAGHEVIHLPLYNVDLNPLESICDMIKQNMADRNEKVTESNIERLANEEIDKITNKDWVKHIINVKQLEEEYWQKERIVDEQIEIISDGSLLDNDDDDDDDKSESGNDSDDDMPSSGDEDNVGDRTAAGSGDFIKVEFKTEVKEEPFY